MRPSLAMLPLTALLLTACPPPRDIESAGSEAPVDSAERPADPASSTPRVEAVPRLVVNHQPTLEKLLGNSGMSLQWISWEPEQRGNLNELYRDNSFMLSGSQKVAGQPGELSLFGYVTRIDKDRFVLRGTIKIKDTPDVGRNCAKTGEHTFAVTQNRKYFRLREFEWCDSLTDYVDIYF